ncbi:MAG TPA: MBL fold metallo-hydrolase [Dehalococcoidales bacterium]|nr:MBL fold metallo-hydrolase [Dehalococcoidales bacterium]
MIIKKMTVGPWRANCYFLVSEQSGEGIIIDPGAEPQALVQAVRTNQWKIKWLIATHGHIDHIGAIGHLKVVLSAPVAIHAQDASALQGDSRFFWGEAFGPPLKPDRLLTEGDIIKTADLRFQVINTPGHTLGGICLYGHGLLFTGDTLFRGNIGSSNIGTGTRLQLIKSIAEKLMTLPPQTIIHPGHGSATTVGEEKQHNSFLYSRDNF